MALLDRSPYGSKRQQPEDVRASKPWNYHLLLKKLRPEVKGHALSISASSMWPHMPHGFLSYLASGFLSEGQPPPHHEEVNSDLLRSEENI